MSLFIHTSDLHLSATEKGYSLACLEEIAGIAREQKTEFVLIAGDLFDTPEDAKTLFRDAAGIMENSGCKWIAIPGNHDPGSDFWTTLSTDRLKFITAPPFTLLSLSENNGHTVEVLGIPHSENYTYRNWDVPAKSSRLRICLAHGTVPGTLPFSESWEEESGGSILEPGLFSHFQCDYAALGHIHKSTITTAGQIPVVYPGSPRVWRKGESDVHGVLLVDGNNGFSRTFIPLKSAGTYRPVNLPVNFDGDIPLLEVEMGKWESPDFVEVQLHGVVEDETSFSDTLKTIEEKGKKVVRKFSLNHDRVRFLPGISDNPMAKDFLERWNEAGSMYTGDQDREAYLRAREIALEIIADNMEAMS